MYNTTDKIDLFSKSIIRRQFAIISAIAIPNSSDCNFENSAIFLTAIQNRFSYMIHRGTGNYNPICFTVFNNTADKVSNKHWEKTVLNFARCNSQRGCIIGYEDIVFAGELIPSFGQTIVSGTIKAFRITPSSSRLTKYEANTSGKITTRNVRQSM